MARSRAPGLLLVCLLTAGLSCRVVEADCAQADPVCNPALAALLVAPAALPSVRYVAGGSNCATWYSTDGKEWLPGGALAGCTTGSVLSMAYAGGRYIAAGSLTGTPGGCGLWFSSNGIDWTALSCGSVTVPLTAAAAGRGPLGREFVVGGYSQNAVDYVSLSSDDLGETWTDRTYTAGGLTAGDYMYSIAYAPASQAYINYQPNTQGTRTRVPRSAWGTTLSNAIGLLAVRLAAGQSVNGVNRVMAISTSTVSAQYTDDLGTSFNTVSPNVFSGSATTAPTDITYGADRFAIVRDNCGYTFSLDGAAEETAGNYVMSNCSGVNLKAIRYLDRYVAGGSSGAFFYSPTGAKDDWQAATTPTSSETVLAIATGKDP